MLTSISNLISKTSPLLASAVTSRYSSLALSMISKGLGLKTHDAKQIFDYIGSNPDSLNLIKEVEKLHEAELLKIAMDNYESEIEAMKNEKAAKIATEKYIGRHGWIVIFLVFAAVFFFGFCLVASYFSTGPANQMFLFLIGQQSGVYLSIYAFYFSGIDPKKIFDNVLKNENDRKS